MLRKMALILFLSALISLPIFGDEQRDIPSLQSLVLYKAQVESELAVLKINYTETHPDVTAKRKELEIVKTEIGKLQRYDQAALAKAGTKYSELLLKKTHALIELANLQSSYTNTHPNVITQNAVVKALAQELEAILPTPVQATNEQTKEALTKFEVKLFEIKYKTPNILSQAIQALGSGRAGTRIDPNDQLKTITVRDLPENILVIQAALERLDKPDPAPVSIQTQIYLIAASDAVGEAAPFPKEIEPVIAQLKATLKYKNYRFVDTFINRVNDGGSVESSGTQQNATNGNPSFMQCKMATVRLATDSTGNQAIRIGKFNFGLRVPIQTRPGETQYQDVGISTELSLSEGGLAVVGTANMGAADSAMIVVVSAKKVK